MTKNTFINSIGQKFWKHIHSNTEIAINDISLKNNRIKFLNDLYMSISKMEYSPSPPRGVLVARRGTYVARFVPALTIKDYCVYFFCLKRIEQYIAKNRVKGTFGGWMLGGAIRRREEEEISSPYALEGSYNRFAWKKNWTNFQNLAYQFYKDKKFKWFANIDIANYYDSINLDRLEVLIRSVVPATKRKEINLLFYFLNHWNKKYLYYEKQNVGLPSDEVGDCSRILANFYLQDYDKRTSLLAKRNEGGYLRFADDQIIGAKTEKEVHEIVFLASKDLARIGLNLNAHKVKVLSRRDFLYYWSFDIFIFLDKKTKVSAAKAFDKFEKRQGKIRSDTVLKRFLGIDIRLLSKKRRKKLIEYLLEEEFVSDIDSYYLGKIYDLLDEERKKDFITYLNRLSQKILFNQFHLRVLKFAKDKGIDNDFRKVNINLARISSL